MVTSCTLPRLEQEIEELENTDALPTAAARGSVATPSPAPRPAPEDQRAEAMPNAQQVRVSRGGTLLAQVQKHPPPPGLWLGAPHIPNACTSTSQPGHIPAASPAVLAWPPGPQFPLQTGASRVSVKNERFMGRGSSPKTTCLSSFLGSPAQWASPVYLHAALSGGAASPFDEKDCGPERLRDWLKATQRSSLY